MRKTFILLITALLMASSAFGAITEATPRAEYTAAGGDTYQCADTGGSSQGWPIWVKTDLRVWLDGTLQVVDTDYTVTFTAGDDSDCSITFVSTPTVGLVVAMERASDQERTSDFATSGPFSMKSMNSQLDYLTTLAQDNAARINRTARLDPGEEIDSAFSRLPQPEASKILGYDASGAYINYTAEEGGSWDGLADLADNSVGKGSDLVAHTGTADTVTEALAKKVAIAGDTMTGDLKLNDGGADTPWIRFQDDVSNSPNTDSVNIDIFSSNFRIFTFYNGGGAKTPFNVALATDTVTSYGNRILTTADEGTGNGLDADTVDGLEASAFQLAAGTKGALVYNNAAVSNPGGLTAIVFDTEVYDTDGIHEGVTNPSRLTVPAGASKVRLSTRVCFDADATGFRGVVVTKTGVTNVAGLPKFNINAVTTALTETCISVSSGVVEVSAGNYFEIKATQTSGGALDILGNSNTWFAMEIIN